MACSGPSVVRQLARAPIYSRSTFASSSRHVLPQRVNTPAPVRLTARHLSYSTARLSPNSKRGAYTIAQPSSEPSGFEGVPAPAYVNEINPTDQKGNSPAAAAVRKPMIKAKKNAITITPNAVDRLRDLMSSPSDPKLLRIGVKSRGCAGMAYHLDYVPPPGGKFDEVVEQDGVKVLIDSKALFSIIGSVMDWRDNRLSAGFVFDNPNVVDTCGCGESFNIKF